MNRIAALNDDSSDDYDEDATSHPIATKEAQESEAFALHRRALGLQQKGEYDESKEVLTELLNHPLIKQSENVDKDSDGPLGPGLLLKYSTYKNLATLASQEDEWDKAMQYYLEAVIVDGTDVSVWYKMGCIALKLHSYPLARHALEQALECNPRHWPSLDKIITVLYALSDYAACLYIISRCLERDSGYVKGLSFMQQIHHEHPGIQVDTAHYFKQLDSSVFQTEVEQEEIDEFVNEALEMRKKKRELSKVPEMPVVKFTKPLTALAWKELGECLVSLYDYISKECNKPGITDYNRRCVTFGCRVDLSQFDNTTLEEASNILQQQREEKKEEPPKNASPVKVDTAIVTASEEPVTTATASTAEAMETTPATSQTDAEIGKQKTEEESAQESPIVSSGAAMSFKKAPGSKKGAKRKQEWWQDEALKRRSSRVRNTAVKKPEEAKINYRELIKKFLPQALLIVREEEDKPVSPESIQPSPELSEDSKVEKMETTHQTEDLRTNEKTDVHNFLKSLQVNSGILDLLNLFLVELAKRDHLKWYSGIQSMYIAAYDRYRNHFMYPNFLCKDDSDERIRDMARMCLVLSELKLDAWLSNKDKTPRSKNTYKSLFGEDFAGDVEYLVMLSPFRCILADLWKTFLVRVFWMRARYFILETNTEFAVDSFERVIEYLEQTENKEDKTVTITNIQRDPVISIDHATKQLALLQQSQSLDEVHRHHDSGDHKHVIELLLQTFSQQNKMATTASEKGSGRHEQLLLLQDSLLKLKDYKKCLLWVEVSFNEALQHYGSSRTDDTKEQWLTTIAKLTDGLETCLKIRESYKHLPSKNRVRLTENLLRLLDLAMEQPEIGGNMVKITVLPWILLYWLVYHEEEIQKASGNLDEQLLEDDSLEENMPASLVILNLAHEYVSRQGRCTVYKGGLLLFTIERLTAELSSVELEGEEPHPFKEDLQNAVEQCFYCLYGHPNKRTKAKHLQEHNAPQVTLTWERSLPLFDYFKPKSMPEYDSYRTSTVSAELENLLRRVFQLIPSSCGSTLCIDTVAAYVEGTITKTPSLPAEEQKYRPVVSELYYLLADYYFKNKEQGKAIKFYMHDLTVTPERFDSWAGMALARASRLEQRLNSHELKNEPGSIHKHSVSALRCFKRALDIDASNNKLWIEYGSLAYQLHSHASRQLKQHGMFPLGEFHEVAKSNRSEMLAVAKRCYVRAGECDAAEDGPEEPWLQHYMLGKIGEKLVMKPQEYLHNYRKAAEFLHEERAKYPKKINYIYSPPHYAVEALEMHFRLHASVMKYLNKYFVKGDAESKARVPFAFMEGLVRQAAAGGFATGQEKDRPKRSAPESEGESSTTVAPAGTLTPTSGPGRPRKRPKLYHPDHTYSKPKVSSESSQESCDTSTCSSPVFSPTRLMSSPGLLPRASLASLPNLSGASIPTPFAVPPPGVPSQHQSPLSGPELPVTPSAVARSFSSVVAKTEDAKPSFSMASILGSSTPKVSPSVALPKLATILEQAGPLRSSSEPEGKPKAGSFGFIVEHLKKDAEKEPPIPKDSTIKVEETVKEKMDEDGSNPMPTLEKMETEEVEEKNEEKNSEEVMVLDADVGKLQEESAIVEKNDEEVMVLDAVSGELQEQSANVDMKVEEIDEEKEVEKEKECGMENDGETEKDLLDVIDSEETGPRSPVNVLWEDDSESLKGLDGTVDEKEKTKEKPKGENEAGTSSGIVVESIPEMEVVVKDEGDKTDNDIKNISKGLNTQGEVIEVNVESEGKKGEGQMDDKSETESKMEGPSYPKSKECETQIEEKKNESEETKTEGNEIKLESEEKSKNKETETETQKMEVTATAKEAGSEDKTACDSKEKSETDTNSETTSKETEESEKLPPEERYHKLMWSCIQALELCLSRFPQHFKSLYRLAHLYATSDFCKRPQWARDLLLGPQDASVSWQHLQHMPCQGLFQERKNTNFFNGLWRIPIIEIDRSGSFTSHIGRCIHLLYEILTELQDSSTLFTLCIQLSKTPEQGKKYLRDLERVYLSRQAYVRCLNVLEKQVATYKPATVPLEKATESSKLPFSSDGNQGTVTMETGTAGKTESEGEDRKFLLQVHRVWRHGISQQIEPKRSNRIFAQAYRVVKTGEVSADPPAPAILEQAIKYCQLIMKPVGESSSGPGRPRLSSRARDDDAGKQSSGAESPQKRPGTPTVSKAQEPKPASPRPRALSPTANAKKLDAANSQPIAKPVTNLPSGELAKHLLERKLQGKVGGSGNYSDSSYKASEDSCSSSSSESSEDEAVSNQPDVICIEDSPIKKPASPKQTQVTPPQRPSSSGYKTPPLPQRTNIFTALTTTVKDVPSKEKSSPMPSKSSTEASPASSVKSQSVWSSLQSSSSCGFSPTLGSLLKMPLEAVSGQKVGQSAPPPPPKHQSPRKSGESDSDVIILESD